MLFLLCFFSELILALTASDRYFTDLSWKTQAHTALGTAEIFIFTAVFKSHKKLAHGSNNLIADRQKLLIFRRSSNNISRKHAEKRYKIEYETYIVENRYAGKAGYH